MSDVHRLSKLLIRLLKGYATNHHAIGHPTRSASNPLSSNHSFAVQYCGLNGEGKRTEAYRPGYVIDALFERQASTFFMSVFFDSGSNVAEYRLVRLTRTFDKLLTNVPMRRRAIDSDDDVVHVSGKIATEGDEQTIGERIIDWIKHEVDRTTGPPTLT